MVIIDLRGTSINPPSFDGWSSASPGQSSLYHPTPLTESMFSLREMSTELHSSSAMFQLHIDKIKSEHLFGHRKTLSAEPPVRIQNKAFTFTSTTILSHAPQSADVDVPRELRASSSSNLDYMLSVAEQESRESAARQRIRDFYRPVLRLHHSSNKGGYSLEKYYADYARKEQLRCKSESPGMGWPRFDDSARPLKKQKRSTSSSDTSLMLYRPPPPWSSIESESVVPDTRISKSSQPSSSRTAVTTSVNKSRMQLIADLKVGVDTAARSKKRSVMNTFDGVKTTGTPGSELNVAQIVHPMLQGRNPFRRPDAGPVATVQSHKDSPADSRTKGVVGVDPDRKPSTSDAIIPRRSLKPISSVRVPQLPPEEMRKLKESMTKKSRASLPSSTSDRTFNDTRRKSLPAAGKDGDIKKILQRQTINTSSSSHRPSVASGVKQPPKGSSSETESTKVKKPNMGFDWKSWGATP